MNQKIFNVILCPVCRGSGFEKFKLPDIERFTDCGVIICSRCTSLYIYQNHILSLVPISLSDLDRELDFLDVYFKFLPKNPLEKKIEALRQQKTDRENQNWQLSEKEFWDQKRYLEQLNRGKKIKYSYNRMEVRKRHITNFIPKNIAGKSIIEFGGGNSATLYYLLNPEEYNYIYFSTDLSFNALLLVRMMHPNAICIQSDAVDPPFKENSFNFIFEFGTLHHLPNHLRVLKVHITLLKKNGYLAFHDPINRRPALLSRVRLLASLKAEQSSHNEYVDESRAIKILEDSGSIIHKHIEYSPIRSWLVHFFHVLLKMNNKFIHYFIVACDQFIIKTLGKIWKMMDGNSILIVWKKCLHK
jgi:SAM-dependent methyltransferase/uncharacterized protein YbaR (Trm112 family)